MSTVIITGFALVFEIGLLLWFISDLRDKAYRRPIEGEPRYLNRFGMWMRVIGAAVFGLITFYLFVKTLMQLP